MRTFILLSQYAKMNAELAADRTLRVDAKVIALVGSAHFVSHFLRTRTG